MCRLRALLVGGQALAAEAAHYGIQPIGALSREWRTRFRKDDAYEGAGLADLRGRQGVVGRSRERTDFGVSIAQLHHNDATVHRVRLRTLRLAGALTSWLRRIATLQHL